MDINKLVKMNFAVPVLINFAFNNEIIGRLVVENNQMKFEGNGNLSAKIFFNQYVKPLVDGYFREKLEMFN